MQEPEGVQYHVTLPTMVLASKNNHQAAVTIQAGTNIEVIGPVENDDRFLVIRIENEEFHIFASDLATRADRVVVRETGAGVHGGESRTRAEQEGAHKARAHRGS